MVLLLCSVVERFVGYRYPYQGTRRGRSLYVPQFSKYSSLYYTESAPEIHASNCTSGAALNAFISCFPVHHTRFHFDLLEFIISSYSITVAVYCFLADIGFVIVAVISRISGISSASVTNCSHP